MDSSWEKSSGGMWICPGCGHLFFEPHIHDTYDELTEKFLPCSGNLKVVGYKKKSSLPVFLSLTFVFVIVVLSLAVSATLNNPLIALIGGFVFVSLFGVRWDL